MSMQTQIRKCGALLGTLALAWLSGCATPQIPNVATYEDPFSGLRTDLIPENLLVSETASGDLVWLDAARVFQNPFDFKYYLEVRYQALPSTGHLEIIPGQSLLLTVDGKQMRFSGMGSVDPKKGPNGTLFEVALYQVAAGDLKAIAAATKVEVVIVGSNRNVQREFQKANFDRFAEFVARTTRP